MNTTEKLLKTIEQLEHIEGSMDEIRKEANSPKPIKRRSLSEALDGVGENLKRLREFLEEEDMSEHG